MVDTTNMIKTSVPGFYKDPKTGLVVNTNDEQLRAYQYGREKSKQLIDLRSELEMIKKALGL